MGMGHSKGLKSSTRRGWVLLSVSLAAVWIASSAIAQNLVAPAVNLDQARNGSSGSPNDPVIWVNGNANQSNSHYTEGYSIPYRLKMTDLPIQLITLDLAYDVKHSSKHAIDYLTHYDRLEPHALFAHTAEEVDPTDGVAGVVANSPPDGTFPIPAPSSVSPCASPAPGQPTTSFNALPAGERVFSIWNGTISSITYFSEGCLTDASAETVIRIQFTPTSSTALLAWGGHIGHRDDWGAGNSAGGISGSPYHMRTIAWDIDNLGNQDRSLSAGAVEAFCTGGSQCDDGNACTADFCNETTDACEHTPVAAGASCEADGNLCTIDQCDANGTCVFNSNVVCPGSTGTCDAGTACTPSTGFCDPLPDPPLSTPCDRDSNACTVDHCDGNGSCVPLSNVVCPNPVGPCDAGSACNPSTGVCDPLPDPPLSTPCEADGNLCTNDHCDGTGSCVFLGNVICPGSTEFCDGGTACTPSTGACDPLPDRPLSTSCEADGNLCTIDHCNGTGSCVTFNNVVCPGSTGTCDAGQNCEPSTGLCVNNPNAPASGTPCEEDGNLCTLEECDGFGSCVFDSNKVCPGPTEFCDGGTACTPATGACDPLPDRPLSTPCEDDGNLCTIDHCNGMGSCVFKKDVFCSGPVGVCDGGTSCTPATGNCDPLPDPPLSTPCQFDGNLCTIDHCDGFGSCVTFDNVVCPGPTEPCDAGTACTPATGACDNLVDPPLSTDCEDDGDLCTIDHCDGLGHCVNFDMVVCPGPIEFCDAGTRCTPATGACDPLPDPPLSTQCERDGDLCTIDHCNGTGSCVTFDNVVCPGGAGVCDAGTHCEPQSGDCVDFPDPPLSTPCEVDLDYCTIEHCNGVGACVVFDNVVCPGPTTFCDAGHACTPATGACDPLPDPPLSTPCERDGNLCTIDHCNGAGSCVKFDSVVCPPPNGPCDGGTRCTPATGTCDPLPEPPLSTPCEADGNLCTLDHCDGAESCVHFDDVVCSGPTGTCDAGLTCDPATGTCVDLPDPTLSTPCEADGDPCTEDHCDGLGSCVLLEILCGACCDGNTGSCTYGFEDDCFGDQREWFPTRTCEDVIATGECQRHRGACCRTFPKESICTDSVLPEDCLGANATWSKGETCDHVTCDIPVIPTMSSWGLTVLALILLVGAKLYFGRRPEISAV